MKYDDNNLSLARTDKILAKIENILGDEGHGMMKKLILDFLYEPQQKTLNITKLDLLIKKLEDMKFQAHQRDVKHIIQEKPMGVKARDRLKHPMNPEW